MPGNFSLIQGRIQLLPVCLWPDRGRKVILHDRVWRQQRHYTDGLRIALPENQEVLKKGLALILSDYLHALNL